jgi:hypothetical protein
MSDRNANVPQERTVCALGNQASRIQEELIVIHAMALRKKYTDQYEEAKRWRL